MLRDVLDDNVVIAYTSEVGQKLEQSDQGCEVEANLKKIFWFPKDTAFCTREPKILSIVTTFRKISEYFTFRYKTRWVNASDRSHPSGSVLELYHAQTGCLRDRTWGVPIVVFAVVRNFTGMFNAK